MELHLHNPSVPSGEQTEAVLTQPPLETKLQAPRIGYIPDGQALQHKLVKESPLSPLGQVSVQV